MHFTVNEKYVLKFGDLAEDDVHTEFLGVSFLAEHVIKLRFKALPGNKWWSDGEPIIFTWDEVGSVIKSIEKLKN